MEHKPFYIVYFNTLVRIKTLKDFLMLFITQVLLVGLFYIYIV